MVNVYNIACLWWRRLRWGVVVEVFVTIERTAARPRMRQWSNKRSEGGSEIANSCPHRRDYPGDLYMLSGDFLFFKYSYLPARIEAYSIVLDILAV